MAFADGRQLYLCNTLDHPITAILSGPDQCAIRLNCVLLPGAEGSFTLPSAPDSIRVFTGDTEACVYLTGIAKTPQRPCAVTPPLYIDNKTLQTMGGWKDLSTMKNIYIHTQDEDLEIARQILTSNGV